MAVFQAVNPVQSILLDYTCTGSEAEVVAEDMVRGLDHTSDEDVLPPSAVYESPHTSLDEVMHNVTVSSNKVCVC